MFSILLLATSLLTAGDVTSDEKLKIRETQLSMAQLANNYRELQAALEKQIADLAKVHGCDIDPATLSCKVVAKKK